jgi:hypothetical protein
VKTVQGLCAFAKHMPPLALVDLRCWHLRLGIAATHITVTKVIGEDEKHLWHSGCH